MASVGWQIGVGGTPIAISSLSYMPMTYGSVTQPHRVASKTRPALSTIFPLHQVPRKPKRELTPLLVTKDVEAPDTADCVVLVSADGANFRVSRTVLAYASPVFHKLFSAEKERLLGSTISSKSPVTDKDAICLTDETLRDGTPVIRLPETGKTLDALLRHLYPFPPSPSSLFDNTPMGTRISIDQVKPVLLAAHKYAMRPVVDELCSRLLSDLSLPPPSSETQPESGNREAREVFA